MLKYLNIIIFFLISFFIPDSKNFINTNFENKISYINEGGKVIINEKEISVSFYGEIKSPPKNAIWNLEKIRMQTILKFTNEEGVIFIQKWDFSNPLNPNLTISVIHKNKEIEIITKINIKNNSLLSDEKMIYNFNTFYSIPSTKMSVTIFDKQNGWAAFKNSDNIFAVKANDNECILKSNNIALCNIQNNKNCTSCQFIFHVSPNSYNFLKNSVNFEKLENGLEFGFFSNLTNILLKIFNIIMNYIQNFYLSLMLIAVLTTILVFPFVLESFKMYELIDKATPELKAAETLYGSNLARYNKEKDKIHERYNISIIKQILGQLFLYIPLSIFRDLDKNFYFMHLMNPFHLPYLHLLLIILLIFITTIYSYFFLKMQLIFSLILGLWFIKDSSLTLTCLIVKYSFIMLLASIIKVLNHGNY